MPVKVSRDYYRPVRRQTNKITLSEFVRIVGFHAFIQHLDDFFGHLSGPYCLNSRFLPKPKGRIALRLCSVKGYWEFVFDLLLSMLCIIKSRRDITAIISVGRFTGSSSMQSITNLDMPAGIWGLS